MSLWADKYRPKTLSSLDYHKKQAEHLIHLTEDGDFPHLLVYGPPGAGKKTRVMSLLREIYGAGVERLKADTMNFTTPSNKKLEITTVSSNHHIELNPSDVGIYDRVVVMEIIKQVAQSQQLDVAGLRDFKVIVLTDVDELTKDAQHALRRTMERYVATCRLVLCATSVSRVIPAIRSRCLCVRVSAPSKEQVADILESTCKRELGDDECIPRNLALEVADMSERNLRRALLTAEALKVKHGSLQKVKKNLIKKPDWRLFITQTVRAALEVRKAEDITVIRNKLYELITNGIPTDLIFECLLDDLLTSCDQHLAEKLIETAAEYEFRMRLGSKEIFHLEAFIFKCLEIYHSDLREIMMNDF